MLKERKKPNLKKKNLTQRTEKEIAKSGLKLELQNGRTHWIGDWSSSPLRAARRRRPSASDFPTPSTSRYFIFVLVSLYLSLSALYDFIWRVKNESEKWNETQTLSLSFFKTLNYDYLLLLPFALHCFINFY